MIKKCLIISGGKYSAIKKPTDNTFIIACDKGFTYAKKANIKPDLIIGDFDSYTGKLPAHIPNQRLQAEKDDTDTLVAIKYAIKQNFSEITITCALGNRLDHAFANIQSCAYAIKHGVKTSIIEDDTEIYFLQNEEMNLQKKQDYSLSVFSLSNNCQGVSIKGVKYELENAELTNSFPLGISNEWKSDSATISVKKGILMVLLSHIEDKTRKY